MDGFKFSVTIIVSLFIVVLSAVYIDYSEKKELEDIVRKAMKDG